MGDAISDPPLVVEEKASSFFPIDNVTGNSLGLIISTKDWQLYQKIPGSLTGQRYKPVYIRISREKLTMTLMVHFS